jgi:integrase
MKNLAKEPVRKTRVKRGHGEGGVSSPLKNPTPCFDKLSMSGSPPRFHCVFPLTLSLSKGAQALFQQPVRRRGKVWYIHFSCGGKQREERTDADSRPEALRILNKRLAKMASSTYSPNVEKTKVAELYDDMHTDYKITGKRVSILEQRWKHLEPVFGKDRARAVTTGRIASYIETRQAEGAENSTIQRELAALHRMFTLGFKSVPQKIDFIPTVPKLEVNNVRSEFFAEAEFRRVCCELPPYLRPLITTAYWMGWRRDELLSFQWRQVNLATGAVRLYQGTTKNKEARLAYLPPEALDTLRQWRDETSRVEREQSRIITHVFHHNGKPIRNFYTAWHSACQRAGVVERRVPHDFRRTAARNYVRSDVPESVAMKILGHKTRSIFDRYNITSEQDLIEAAQKVRPADSGKILAEEGKDSNENPTMGRK